MKFKNKQIIFSIVLIMFFYLISFSVNATSDEMKNSTKEEKVLQKYNGFFIVEENNINISNVGELNKKDKLEVASLLKDLNLLYKYGNIYLSENGQIEFKDISEIIETKNLQLQNNSILENNNDEDDNVSMFGIDPDAPIFALESKAKANVNY